MAPRPALIQHLEINHGHANYTVSGNNVTFAGNVSPTQLKTLIDVAQTLNHKVSVVSGVLTVTPGA